MIVLLCCSIAMDDGFRVVGMFVFRIKPRFFVVWTIFILLRRIIRWTCFWFQILYLINIFINSRCIILDEINISSYSSKLFINILPIIRFNKWPIKLSSWPTILLIQSHIYCCHWTWIIQNRKNRKKKIQNPYRSTVHPLYHFKRQMPNSRATHFVPIPVTSRHVRHNVIRIACAAILKKTMYAWLRWTEPTASTTSDMTFLVLPSSLELWTFFY